MDLDDLKQMLNKVFKGCGCMSIAFCGLLLVVGLFADDDESKSETDNSDQKEAIPTRNSTNSSVWRA